MYVQRRGATESLLEYVERCRITVCWMQHNAVLDSILRFATAVLDEVTQSYTVVTHTRCYVGVEVRDEA